MSKKGEKLECFFYYRIRREEGVDDSKLILQKEKLFSVHSMMDRKVPNTRLF